MENKQHTTMAIIHCGFVPHQSKNINKRLISEQHNFTTKS